MLGRYIHAAIANQWLWLHRLVGILPRSVPLAYAAQLLICSTVQQRLAAKQSIYGGNFLMSNNIPHWNKAEDHG